MISRFGWIPSPTWFWSRFNFNELNFLSGGDFDPALEAMGDFCIYFMYRIQRPVCHLCVCVYSPRHLKYSIEMVGRGQSSAGPEVRGMEVAVLCPAWL